MCLVIGTDRDDADPDRGRVHARPAMAILRALLEALQARLTFIAGSRDDMGGALYEAAPRAGAGARGAPMAEPRLQLPLPVATSADTRRSARRTSPVCKLILRVACGTEASASSPPST